MYKDSCRDLIARNNVRWADEQFACTYILLHFDESRSVRYVMHFMLLIDLPNCARLNVVWPNVNKKLFGRKRENLK